MEGATDPFGFNCCYSQTCQNFCDNPDYCGPRKCQNLNGPEGSTECYEGPRRGPRLSSLERDGIYHAKYFKPPNYFPRSLDSEIGQGDACNQEKEKIPVCDDEDKSGSECGLEKCLILNGKLVHPNVQMALARCYQENRGPLLAICTPKGQVCLTLKEYCFVEPADCSQTLLNKCKDKQLLIERLVPQTFVEEQLEPFVTSSGHAETKWVVLINRGTTVVHVQWRRSPLFKGLAEEDNLGESMCTSNDVIQLSTERAEEFQFVEGNVAVLPGKTIKMPILFQSKTTGWFYENLYLYTEPKLTDDEGRVLKLRLSAVCNDEMAVAAHGWNETSQVEKVAQAIRDKLIRSRIMKTVDHICRQGIESGGICKQLCGISGQTAENQFNKNNPKFLNFRFQAANEALASLTELLKAIFGDEIIMMGGLCPWSLQDLYTKLTEAPITDDVPRKIFEKEETESLLEKLNQSTNSMLEAREVRYFSRNGPEGMLAISKVVVSSMVIEMAEKALEIKRMMYAPARANLRREYFRAKLADLEGFEECQDKCAGDSEGVNDRGTTCTSFQKARGTNCFTEERDPEFQNLATERMINRLVMETLESEFRAEQRSLIAKLLRRCSRDLARTIQLGDCVQDYCV